MNGKRYTREELISLGMNESQIKGILNGYYMEDAKAAEELAEATISEEPIQQQNLEGLGTLIPVNCAKEMKATSISDLQSYSKGTLVRLPDFAEGQPFVARVRRPSMLVLAKQGKIPNTLLASANELFTRGGGGMDGDNEGMLADIYSICEIICEASLLEPTYQQIQNAGLELSDDQLMAIFNYTQTGIKALESFR